MTTVLENCQKIKKASEVLKKLETEKKNQILYFLSKEIISSKKEIIENNQKDLSNAKKSKLSNHLIERLELNSKKIDDLSNSVLDIVSLPDPNGDVLIGKTLPNGIEMVTKRVPLGVIMVIYESRPNVTIDVSVLCFKSSNACILRGGKEAFYTNKFLVQLFQTVLERFEVPRESVSFIDNTDRNYMLEFFEMKQYIDLIVPRGGENLINFVSTHSRIPVIKHEKGLCNLYIDKTAKNAIEITFNSKIQRPSVCNAIENLILHRDFPDIKIILKTLKEKKVDLLLDSYLYEKFPEYGTKAKSEDYFMEFLDLKLSVFSVCSVQEAIDFIKTHSSFHTEGIVSEDYSSIQLFKDSLDSAGIFVNCSTRFHDGGQFGFGAEVGISTEKLHVRGPMGLFHLTTTTTYLSGNGQVRN